MGVAFRKLEPDRPRRTTDGGSPRRGRKAKIDHDGSGTAFKRAANDAWLVDTDGQRVVPLNIGSRFPADDLQRGTLEAFYESWNQKMAHARVG